MTAPSTTQTLPDVMKLVDDLIDLHRNTFTIGDCKGAYTNEQWQARFAIQNAVTALASQTQAVAENIREGAPYDDPRFEALCREHGIWGTAQAALCAVFWRQAVAVPANLAGAILSLNTSWNQKEPEDVIAGKLDLCRRLALDTTSPQAAGQKEDAKDDEIKRLTNELRYIANADVASWDDPSEFRAWAQNRARAAITNSKDES